MYQRIVVPLDGSAMAEGVLPHATAIARALGAEILLVRVVPGTIQLSNLGLMEAGSLSVPDVDMMTQTLEAQAAQAEQYLQGLQGKSRDLQGQGLQVRATLLRGDAATEIVHYAQEQGAGLIALSTHGRGGITHLLLGSVAYKVAQSGIPVLLVRPREGK